MIALHPLYSKTLEQRVFELAYHHTFVGNEQVVKLMCEFIDGNLKSKTQLYEFDQTFSLSKEIIYEAKRIREKVKDDKHQEVPRDKEGFRWQTRGESIGSGKVDEILKSIGSQSPEMLNSTLTNIGSFIQSRDATAKQLLKPKDKNAKGLIHRALERLGQNKLINLIGKGINKALSDKMKDKVANLGMSVSKKMMKSGSAKYRNAIRTGAEDTTQLNRNFLDSVINPSKVRAEHITRELVTAASPFIVGPIINGLNQVPLYKKITSVADGIGQSMFSIPIVSDVDKGLIVGRSIRDIISPPNSVHSVANSGVAANNGIKRHTLGKFLFNKFKDMHSKHKQ